jgi:thiamine biosynthesis lipoprotein
MMRALMLFASFGAVAIPATGTAQSRLTRYEFVELHMGTLFRIVLFAPTRADADAAAHAAFARVEGVNRVFSDYDSTSEVRRLTRQPVGSPVPVSAELFELLTRAQAFASASDGAFDVTVGPIVQLWRRARRTRVLPAEHERREALGAVGYRHLVLDPAQQTVTLGVRGIQLDFGGIAKGAAADAALAELRRRGLTRALVAAGGDLALGDPPPDASGWEIEVEHLRGAVGRLSRGRRFANCGISTSGDGAQFVEINGVRYAHIVDPRTGLGLIGRPQVTVVAPTATDSDALATAVYVLGEARGRTLVAGRAGVELWIERPSSIRFRTIGKP